MYLKFILKRQKKCMSAFGNTSFLIENHFAYIFSIRIINNGNFVCNAWLSPIFDVACSVVSFSGSRLFLHFGKRRINAITLFPSKLFF